MMTKRLVPVLYLLFAALVLLFSLGTGLAAAGADAVPPAPTSLFASGGRETTHVLLTWDEVPAADSFEVYRAKSPTGTRQLIGTPTPRSFKDTTAAGNTLYTYWVKACNDDGCSPFSQPATGWRAGAPPAGAPADVFSRDGVSPDFVRTTWTPVQFATSYSVYRARQPLDDPGLLAEDVKGNAWDDTMAAPATFYTYWVRGCNPAGCGPLSEPNTGWRLAADGRLPVGAVLPVIARNPPATLYFFDDFSNPASGWPLVDDAFARSAYTGGEYQVQTKQSGFVYYFLSPAAAVDNYTVSVDARWDGTSNAGYGIIFGADDAVSRYYMLLINVESKEYVLLRRGSGGFTELARAGMPAVKAGLATNRVSVVRSGANILFSVNGEQRGPFVDGTFTGPGRVGVATTPFGNRPVSDARFDNFLITLLPATAAASDGVGAASVDGGKLNHFAEPLVRPLWQGTAP